MNEQLPKTQILLLNEEGFRNKSNVPLTLSILNGMVTLESNIKTEQSKNYIWRGLQGSYISPVFRKL